MGKGGHAPLFSGASSAARLLERLPHSALGPDGLSCDSRAQDTTCSSGATPRWSRAPTLPDGLACCTWCTFQKATRETGLTLKRAYPRGACPLTLSNASQKSVIGAATLSLDAHARAVTHPMLRGGVQGRSLLDNLIDIDTSWLQPRWVRGPPPPALSSTPCRFPQAPWGSG